MYDGTGRYPTITSESSAVNTTSDSNQPERKQPDNKRPLMYVLFKKYGLHGALRILWKDVGFDIRHRVNTAAPISQRRLYAVDSTPEQNRYVASTFDVLRHVLDYAALQLDAHDCGFVDLGSGKGKALIAACDYPFKSRRGVELSPLANSIARRNLKRLNLQDKVELQESSATQFTFLPHERIVYFFNSFTGDVLQQTLHNLACAQREAIGLFIYVNPTERTQVETFFPCVKHVFIDPGQCEVTFHHLPANS